MIKNNGFKCTDASGQGCAMPYVSYPAFAVAIVLSMGQSHVLFDLEDQGGINIEGKVLFLIMILRHRFSFQSRVSAC